MHHGIDGERGERLQVQLLLYVLAVRVDSGEPYAQHVGYLLDDFSLGH